MNMRKRITKEEKALAFEMGVKAFQTGTKFAPCLDKSFMNVFIANSENVGDGIAPMKAWAQGWTVANLADEVRV